MTDTTREPPHRMFVAPTRRRKRPDIGPGAYDEIALGANGVIYGRSSTRGRGRWGKVAETGRTNRLKTFEQYAERWGYEEVIE